MNVRSEHAENLRLRYLTWSLFATGLVLSPPTFAKMDVRNQGGATQVKFCDATIRENSSLRLIINGQTYPIKGAPNAVDMMCTEWTSLPASASRPGTSIRLERFNSSGQWAEVETRSIAGTAVAPAPSQPSQPSRPSVINARMTLSIPASGVAQAQVCGLPPNTRVGFQIEDASGDEYQTMNQIAASNGCATQSYANGLLKNGMRVKATFNGMSLTERVQTTSVPVVPRPPQPPQPTPWGTPRPQPTPAPTPRPQPTVAPTPVPKAQVNPSDLTRAGIQAADLFIADVIEVYATLEQAQLSFRLGFRSSQRDFESASRYESLPVYATAVQEGRNRGQADGIQQGQQRGQRDGENLGRTDAVSRFSSVVGKNQVPDRSLRPMQVTVPTFSPSIGSPASIESRFSASVPAFRQEMVNQMRVRAILWGDGDFTRLFVDAYDFTNRPFTSALRNMWGSDPASEAFSFWARKRDRNLRNRGDQLRDYINRVTSPEFANPDTNLRIFRQAFERQFEENFGRAWNQKVSQVDAFAFVYGQQQYQTVRSAYARELGQVAGYRMTFGASAESAFQTAFERAFTSAFSQEVNELESKPRITQMDVRVANRSAVNGREAAPGDQIQVQVGLENIGYQAAELPVLINGVQFGVIRAERSSRDGYQIPQAFVLPAPTTLITRQRMTSEVAVRITVGSTERNLSFAVSYVSILKSMSSSPDSQVRTQLKNLVVESIKNEWNELTSQGGTQYDNATLLSETRTLVQAMSLTERQSLKASGLDQALREVIGDQPWWWSGYQKDWNYANDIIDDIARILSSN